MCLIKAREQQFINTKLRTKFCTFIIICELLSWRRATPNLSCNYFWQFKILFADADGLVKFIAFLEIAELSEFLILLYTLFCSITVDEKSKFLGGKKQHMFVSEMRNAVNRSRRTCSPQLIIFLKIKFPKPLPLF